MTPTPGRPILCEAGGSGSVCKFISKLDYFREEGATLLKINN
jgi:hypothetical protein